MKKIVRSVLKFGIVFSCFFGIMIFFIVSSNLTQMLGNHLHILPSYTGGNVALDIYDSCGDDYGDKNLVYPSNASFTEGSLDLVRYTVYEPVMQAKWQQNAEYWQLEAEYKNSSSKVRNIMIYIDLDNVLDGSTEPLFDSAENVVFTSEHPWDIAVWICNGEGKVYDSNKEFLCNTEIYEVDGGKTVKVRIPLQNEFLQTVYSSQITYHYVLTGGYSQFDRGGFMPLEKRKSMSRGGTKSAREYNALIPKVYDVLGDNSQLGTWNKEDFSKAMIVPVEVKMHPEYVAGTVKKGKNRTENNESEEVYKKVFEEYSKIAEQDSMNMFENPEEAAEFYKKKLSENPEDYVSMAYYGSCLAVQGGKASVIQAVALVNEAFKYLDKAVELSYGKEGEIDVLMNRASVAYSVPNEVFEKAETAISDFSRIIELYKQKYTEEELAEPENYLPVAYCYVMISQINQKLGRKTDEFLALQEAKELIEYK